MKWMRKDVQIRTRNYPMDLLQQWGGCDIIEWRWYNREKAHIVMDSLGDVYIYKPKCGPSVVPPKEPHWREPRGQRCAAKSTGA